MSATLLEVHPDNPEKRKIKTIVECLKDGGTVIYPTDTVYGLGCDIHNLKAVEKVARIKGVKAEKTSFSFICYDLKHIAEYAKVENECYKLMKQTLPGAYTFILQASSNVPKLLKSKTKKTVGIRVPNHNIPRDIVQALGNPIITTSLKSDSNFEEYIADPEAIYEHYKHDVDIIVNGGPGKLEASTIIDCTTDEFSIIREGVGSIAEFAYPVQ